MTIEIIEAELSELDGDSLWACWLEISQAAESYLLPATAPGTLLQADLQAHFDAKETKLFALAQAKGLDIEKIYDFLPKHIARAFALVTLDEINVLRSEISDLKALHSLPALAQRTATQLRQAVKNKLKSF